MLSRRIPLPPNQPPVRTPQQPASALPPYLQRSASVTGHTSRPPSRPGTPPSGPVPYRSSSPLHNRPMSVPPRPHSPAMSTISLGNPIPGSHPSMAATVDPVDVDLVVRSIPRSTLQAGKPFCVVCTLGVSASIREGQQRTLSLAVQHVQPSTTSTKPGTTSPAATTTTAAATTNARLASAVAMAMASSPASRSSLTLLDGPLVGSPHAIQPAEHGDDMLSSRQGIPPPEPMHGDEARYDKLREATRFLGASMLRMPPMTLVRTHTESSSEAAPGSGGGGDNDVGGNTTTSAPTAGKEVQFWDFELEYTPLRTGFVPVGGLRVLVLEDRVQGAEEEYPERRSSVAPAV